MNPKRSFATDENGLTRITKKRIMLESLKNFFVLRQGNIYSYLSVFIPVLLWLILFLGAFSISAAQTVYTTVQIPYPLENMGHSPRALALGSAYSAAEGDASCLYWNPAGLDGLPSGEISLIHESWLADISQETFLASLPLAKLGTLALGANYLNFGSLDGYDNLGESTAASHPFRGSLALGWGGTLWHGLSLGLSGKGFYQSLTSDLNSVCGSLTAGFLWRVLPTLRVGAFYTFLASASAPDLGLFKLGETWAVSILKGSPTLFVMDFSMPPKGVYLLQGGVEQVFLSRFFARVGYQQELRDNQIQGFRGLTAGAGIDWEGFDLDYSYIPDGDLGFAQMLGLTYHFPEPKPKAASSGSALSFKPPAEITSADRVVQVEVHFDLPSSPNSGAPTQVSPGLQKDLDEASSKVQANPKDAKAWVALGNLYWQAGQPEFTLQSFEEALKLEPQNTQLKAWLDQYHRIHNP